MFILRIVHLQDLYSYLKESLKSELSFIERMAVWIFLVLTTVKENLHSCEKAFSMQRLVTLLTYILFPRKHWYRCCSLGHRDRALSDCHLKQLHL